MDKNDYQDYVAKLDQAKLDKQMKHTVYLSRRAIWANILWSILIPIAGYMHTRRWKQLGIFFISVFIISFITAGDEGFEEGVKRGKQTSPFFVLIAIIDNSIAIQKAREKIKY